MIQRNCRAKIIDMFDKCSIIIIHFLSLCLTKDFLFPVVSDNQYFYFIVCLHLPVDLLFITIMNKATECEFKRSKLKQYAINSIDRFLRFYNSVLLVLIKLKYSFCTFLTQTSVKV